MKVEVGQKWVKTKAPHETFHVKYIGDTHAFGVWSDDGLTRYETSFSIAGLEIAWTLVGPKPPPEGWELTNTPRYLKYVERPYFRELRVYRGTNGHVSIITNGGDVRLDPDSLKEAIDYVMEQD